MKDVPEGHICCGSAGIYNILQPEIAAQLRARKVANIERIKPDLVATGNIGCMTQIGKGTDIPIVHTVELLDWATGGPLPEALQGMRRAEPGAGEGGSRPIADLTDARPPAFEFCHNQVAGLTIASLRARRRKRSPPRRLRRISSRRSWRTC